MTFFIIFLAVFTAALNLIHFDQSKRKPRKSRLRPSAKTKTKTKAKPKSKLALSAIEKGKLGEKAFRLTMKLHLPTCYRALHDVTLYTDQGDTTQIDHIIISRYGIFVIETKARSGLIFGTVRQAQWTQKIHTKSFKFQNPLRQNYKHLKTIEKFIHVPSKRMHSVIVFFGSCELKTELPPNVARGEEYINYVKSFTKILFTDAEVGRMISTIENARLPPGAPTDTLHIQNLNKRFSPSKSHG